MSTVALQMDLFEFHMAKFRLFSVSPCFDLVPTKPDMPFKHRHLPAFGWSSAILWFRTVVFASFEDRTVSDMNPVSANELFQDDSISSF